MSCTSEPRRKWKRHRDAQLPTGGRSGATKVSGCCARIHAPSHDRRAASGPGSGAEGDTGTAASSGCRFQPRPFDAPAVRRWHSAGSTGPRGSPSCALAARRYGYFALFLPPYRPFWADSRLFRPQESSWGQILPCFGVGAAFSPGALRPYFFHGLLALRTVSAVTPLLHHKGCAASTKGDTREQEVCTIPVLPVWHISLFAGNGRRLQSSSPGMPCYDICWKYWHRSHRTSMVERLIGKL